MDAHMLTKHTTCVCAAPSFPGDPVATAMISALGSESSGESRGLPRPPLALIGNSQEWAARSIESVLGSNGYAVLRAFTSQQTLEYSRTASPDVIIMDAALADTSAVELCRQLRQEGIVSPATPIVITTSGVPTEADEIRALQAGAWELIGVPLKYELLLLKLGAFVHAKMEAEQAREESLVDSLSGLYNTRGMLRRVRELGLDAARHGHPVACVAFSAEVEAAPGESSSAAVSPQFDVQLAGALTSLTRSSDALGRLREHEFILLAPHTDAQGARSMAQRITSSSMHIPDESGMELNLRVRAGCYAIDPLRTQVDPIELLTRATRALRRSQADHDASPIQFYDDSALAD